MGHLVRWLLFSCEGLLRPETVVDRLHFPSQGILSLSDLQIHNLSARGKWPLTSRPDRGQRKGSLICSQKTRGDRVMDSGSLCPDALNGVETDQRVHSEEHLSHCPTARLPLQCHTRKPHWPDTYEVQLFGWSTFLHKLLNESFYSLLCFPFLLF